MNDRHNRLRGRGRRYATWGLAVLAVALLAYALRQVGLQELLRQVLAGVDRLGAWGYVLFVVCYVLATVLLVPGLILTLGAGVLFGVVTGTALVSLASTLGATCAFVLGRFVARERVAARFAASPRLDAIDRAIGREGWKIVALTRLSPVFPFVLLNYAYGLTRVSLRHYFWASWLGMLPGTLLYVYVGALIGDLALLDSAQRSRTAAEWVFYLLGLAATATVTVYVTRLARAALKKKV